MTTDAKRIFIRKLEQLDIALIVERFAAHHWPKPASTFDKYLQEQQEGIRQMWLAFDETQFAGYVTLTRESLYQPFRKNKIPEIMDLNVLPPFRNKRIGSLLIETAEQEAFKENDTVGIGVGLYEGYGQAQKIYICRGYKPDGCGVTYNYRPIEPGKSVCLDDDLILWFTKASNKTPPSISPPTPVVRSIKNATHFNWGNKCDGWWLKEDSNFTVIEEHMPLGTSEKKHYHKETEQFFYCLSGTLLIDLGDQNHTLEKHDGITIPAKQAHKVQNASLGATTFLVISVPNSHEDRVDLE